MTKQELIETADGTELQNGLKLTAHVSGVGVAVHNENPTPSGNKDYFINYRDFSAYAGWQKKPEKKPPFSANQGHFVVREEYVLGSLVFSINTGSFQSMLLNKKFLPDLIDLLTQLAAYRKDEI